jgi:diacylglycerol kinase (ATP)
MTDEQTSATDHPPRKGKTGLARIYWATLYSLDGLLSACRHEPAFRQELLLAVVLIPTALLLPVTATQKALLCGSVILVLIVELLNSAVEATVDRISMQQHELAKRAKDTGSAAVFLSLCVCGLVWALVLYERFA